MKFKTIVLFIVVSVFFAQQSFAASEPRRVIHEQKIVMACKAAAAEQVKYNEIVRSAFEEGVDRLDCNRDFVTLKISDDQNQYLDLENPGICSTKSTCSTDSGVTTILKVESTIYLNSLLYKTWAQQYAPESVAKIVKGISFHELRDYVHKHVYKMWAQQYAPEIVAKVVKAIAFHELQHYKHKHGAIQRVFSFNYPMADSAFQSDKKFLSWYYLSRAHERQADIMSCIDKDGAMIPEVAEGQIMQWGKIYNAQADEICPDDVTRTHPSDASRLVRAQDLYTRREKPTNRELAEMILCGHEKDPQKQCPRFIDAWIKASRKATTK